MWLHLPCYELLIASYPPGPQPSLGDLEAFGDATGRVYRSPGAKSATVASIRGAFYPARSNGCSMIAFVRIGSEDSPAEILNLIAEAIGCSRYLVVLGESRRLIEDLRRNTHRNNPYMVIDLNQVDGILEEVMSSTIGCRMCSFSRISCRDGRP